MAEDKSVVKPVEAPALKPLVLRNRLAATPRNAPKYSVAVTDASGQSVTLGDPRATRALVALMDVHAVNGGAACHWGGPAAFAEIMAAIHGVMFAAQGREWYEAYNFSNDAGHTENGVYALRANYGFDGLTFDDLKKFRSIESKLTGHGESHLNPEGVLLSNGPLGSSLPQAQGLAMADRVAGNDRVTIVTVSDGASMEGEAKEAFAAVPLAWSRELKWSLDNVNVNGGAIALGHPLGASGARLLTTLLHEMEKRGERYGLSTMCIGFGQATATIIERLA